MMKNKIKFILVLFIILSLSMNAFSATNFTDDSSGAALQSSSVDEVAADAADDGTDSQDTNNNGDSDSTTTDEKQSKPTFGGNGTGLGFGNGTGFGGNGTGINFNRSGGNSSGFDFASIMDLISKLMGGDNATNATNETTNATQTVNSQVNDVPKVVTSESYTPVSESPAPVEKQSSHVIQRLRDNKTISEGSALKLEGLNKLYDTDFTNGHLLVYVDGKLVFNEITADDLSTPIFWITDDYLGQHQITVEFTANGNSNTNKYTEDVLII